MIGDVDDNGKVTSVDASKILYFYAELNSGSVDASLKDMYVCDVNRDGKINATDASICLVYYAEVAAGYSDNLASYLINVLGIKGIEDVYLE